MAKFAKPGNWGDPCFIPIGCLYKNVCPVWINFQVVILPFTITVVDLLQAFFRPEDAPGERGRGHTKLASRRPSINPQNSSLEPIQEVGFLGVVLNSVDITTTLAYHRKKRIKKQGLQLLRGDITLHDLASFNGLAMAAKPAVKLPPLRYKYLEIILNRKLVLNFEFLDGVLSNSVTLCMTWYAGTRPTEETAAPVGVDDVKKVGGGGH
ncbi:hypothetical protein E2C01_053039 [Portunus trituberculatus]|uniref:Uncharacterized protein n=1 Tax=Portunus trituberculatus TaxID=210409 RepID=A0A5B7GQX8_PORTR|nr:hypothetical protein [Portunus trituberculatus]